MVKVSVRAYFLFILFYFIFFFFKKKLDIFCLCEIKAKKTAEFNKKETKKNKTKEVRELW